MTLEVDPDPEKCGWYVAPGPNAGSGHVRAPDAAMAGDAVDDAAKLSMATTSAPVVRNFITVNLLTRRKPDVDNVEDR